MQFDSLKSAARSWINPPNPGYGKNPVVGFLVGFFLGPIGIGLFLRSLVDLGLSLILCMTVIGVFEFKGAPICWVACGLWIVGRIRRDTQRVLESRRTAGANGSDANREPSARPQPDPLRSMVR